MKLKNGDVQADVRRTAKMAGGGDRHTHSEDGLLISQLPHSFVSCSFMSSSYTHRKSFSRYNRSGVFARGLAILWPWPVPGCLGHMAWLCVIYSRIVLLFTSPYNDVHFLKAILRLPGGPQPIPYA